MNHSKHSGSLALRRWTVLTLALGLVSLNSEAALLVSTFGQPAGSLSPHQLVNTSGRYASDFQTGGDPATVTTLTLSLDGLSAASGQSLIAEIWLNSAGTPSALFASFDTTASVAAGSDVNNYTLGDVGINLAADTIYWLVLRQSGNDGAFGIGAALTEDQDVDGVTPFSGVAGTPSLVSVNGGANWSDSTGFFPDSSDTLRYQLDFVPVPEPSHWLAGAGLVLVAGGHWLRQRRNSARQARS
ncbi:MAG: hypothetical protein HZA90_21375 [Verrucomicrobia bacterium]|nr:hypothetical protein [Verrucomicrobiota bacterium]